VHAAVDGFKTEFICQQPRRIEIGDFGGKRLI